MPARFRVLRTGLRRIALGAIRVPTDNSVMTTANPAMTTAKPAPATLAAVAMASAAVIADRPRDAFARVVNLRTIAGLFYVCLVVVLSSQLVWIFKYPPERWWFDTAFVLRQTLISAACTLLAVGGGAAVLAQRATRGPVGAWPALGVFGAAVVIGAVCGVVLRIAASRSGWAQVQDAVAYLTSIALLWMLIGGVVAAMYWMRRAAADANARIARMQAEQARLEAQMSEAQLAALQAQIEPHFLFNTLANVKRLYETEPGAARTMLTSLVAYLRAALPAMRAHGSTVAGELALASSYLTILGMRMGDRLRFRIEADPAVREASLPTMVVSTLVENAVKHGLSALPEGGEIVVQVHAAGDRLRIVVADTGAGFVGVGGAGVGLANTRARLSARYGAGARLWLTENLPRGVRACVELPLETKA